MSKFVWSAAKILAVLGAAAWFMTMPMWSIPGKAAGGAWSCSGHTSMSLKGSVPRGLIAGASGGALTPRAAIVTWDPQGLSVWLEGQPMGRVDFAATSGWEYTSGTNTQMTPASAALFVDDDQSTLKVAVLHDRGHNFNTPSVVEPLMDLYVINIGCRFG